MRANEHDSFVVRSGKIAERLAGRIRRRPSARVERALLVASLFAFILMGSLAIRTFPDVGSGVRWRVLIPVGVIGMSANLFLNAFEFVLIGRVVDQRVRFARAMKVTIVGSAANLLPLPGSTLVRVQALASDGARYRHAITASIAVGVMAVGASLLLVGAFNLASVSVGLVLVAVVAGLLVILSAFAMLRTAADTAATRRYGSWALMLETSYSTFSALRLWLIFLGLGLDVGLTSAVALSAVGTVATAVGFFPGGLGLNEALVGAISPLVAVPIAVGLTGAVVARLFSFAVLAAASCFLLAKDGVSTFKGDGASSAALSSNAPLETVAKGRSALAEHEA